MDESRAYMESVKSDREEAGIDYQNTVEAVAAFLRQDGQGAITGVCFMLRVAGQEFTFEGNRGFAQGEDLIPLVPQGEHGPLEDTDSTDLKRETFLSDEDLSGVQVALQAAAIELVHILDQVAATEVIVG
jgi:hypothetical protein